MASRNTFIRAVDELSLAAWFGGSLMGAIGLEKGAAAAHDQKLDVESAGWAAWQPLQTTAMVAQLASGAAMGFANKGRMTGQRGVGKASALRTVLTGAAVAATAMAARSGRQVNEAAHDGGRAESSEGVVPMGDGSNGTSLEELEKRTRALQWAVPVLTGSLLVMDAMMGEQQRPTQVAEGMARRVLPDAVVDRVADRLAA